MIEFDIFDHSHLYGTIWGPQTHCANLKLHFGFSGIFDFRRNSVTSPCLVLVVKNLNRRENYD